MSARPNVFVLIAVLALILSATIQAQTTTPAYLSQFPSPERIKADVRGIDAMDTAAKQAGIFWQLKQLISLLAYAQKRTDRQFTADEQRLDAVYRNAYYYATEPFEGKVSGDDKPKWFELHTKYENDLWLRDEVFKKYLSPETRRGLYAALKGEVPTQSAPAGSLLTPSSAAPASSASAATKDPSIAKAKIAKVDTTVFGWQLGEPLRLRPCPLIMIDVEENCHIKGQVPLGVDPATGLEYRLAEAVVRTVRLTPANCPSWVTNCDVNVMIRDGNLVGLYIYTAGRDVEKATNGELRAKYGEPSGAYIGMITPDVGNKFNVEDPEWNLPGLHVEYQVIFVPDNGRLDIRRGIVWIETDATHQLRLAAKKAPVKRKL
jgi:hypothetical protein